ncbi:hypothetical protein ABRT01_17515 [Lentibacillus sp. L22]|uniref:hypothetical protein n=1 Tax=Lentibacillus sp. L22 TaxID=3163028 RepID=UPI00346614C8
MTMQCYDRLIQRYYHILTAYLAVAKWIESCDIEDKEFYQDICFLFADKIKFMQAEMADQGFVLCQGNRTSFCENEEKNNKK